MTDGSTFNARQIGAGIASSYVMSLCLLGHDQSTNGASQLLLASFVLHLRVCFANLAVTGSVVETCPKCTFQAQDVEFESGVHEAGCITGRDMSFSLGHHCMICSCRPCMP